MANKVLVAVDESKNSMRAVKYVAQTMRPDASIALLSVLPDATAACGLDSPSLTPLFKANRQAFCTIEDQKRYAVQEFMDEAVQVLLDAGFARKNIKASIRKKKTGIARDILREAKQGGYDTIVLGRKGLSGVKEFLMGSVPTKILSRAEDIAVIVVH